MPIYELSFILLVLLPLQEVPLVADVFEFFSIHHFLKIVMIYISLASESTSGVSVNSLKVTRLLASILT